MAEAHRRTTLAMTSLRSTLRDEHHCLLQVRKPLALLPRRQSSRAGASSTLQAEKVRLNWTCSTQSKNIPVMPHNTQGLTLL